MQRRGCGSFQQRHCRASPSLGGLHGLRATPILRRTVSGMTAEPLAETRQMRIEVGGTRLFFDVEGPACADERIPTLLLVHGGPGFDHSSFKPTFSQLRDVARVVYLDLRGHGRSDPVPSQQWTLAQWSDDIK